MEKKKNVLIAIVVFVVGLIITGSSYAFWTWNSNVNKNVVFNSSNNIRSYIVYDEGESAFSGDLTVSNSYTTGGIHSTISIYKTSAAANMSLMATIHMDVASIGETMQSSRALKWVVTEGTSSLPGSVIAEGNFVGVNSGSSLILVPNIVITSTETFYTIWIYIDSTANPSSNLSGEVLDANVWTEINQYEDKEDKYEITRANANNQRINATVIDTLYKVTSYAITDTNDAPSNWTDIPVANQNNVYNLNTTVNATGTYYVWFKDENNRVVGPKTVTVSMVDTTAPTCSWGSFSSSLLEENETANITLTCTDSESGISVHRLTPSDITVSNNGLTVSNVTKTATTNGFVYTITVTATSNDGTATLTLAADKIKNSAELGNASVTSESVTINNHRVYITGGSTQMYGNSNAVTLTCSYNKTYASGLTGYYQFGYSDTSDGEVTWSEATTSTTLTIAADEFAGNRYYHCGSYASDGNTTTNTIISMTPTVVAFNRIAITLDATTNGGTLGEIPSPIYVGYEGTNLYTTASGDTTIVPLATKTNYSLTGWYTAASGGTMVIDDDGIVQSSITGYTNQNGEFILTTGTTLYAQFRQGYYINVDTGNTYTTLRAALSAVAADETIRVLTSRTETTTATNSKTGVKLDLNGKTITMGGYSINNSGGLDIYNGSSKEAIITGSGSSTTNYSVIYNSGTLTTNATSSANSVVIRNTYSYYYCGVIYNNTGGEVTLNANTLVTFTVANQYNNASRYYRYVITTLGTLYINGARITNNQATRPNDNGINIGNANGRVVMTSGVINASGTAIYNSNGTGTTTPAIDISGGSITANSYAIYGGSTSGKIKITGGTITGGGIAVLAPSSGQLEMSAGSITGSTVGIQTVAGALTVTGGTITGNTKGIYITGYGTLTLGEDDGNVSINSPIIYGGSSVIDIPSGTWNYYDGVLYSTSLSYTTKDYVNVASGHLPITEPDDYGYKTYLGTPTYSATFYYNSNSTSGGTTVSSIQSGCMTEVGSSTCDIIIPASVIRSVGTYNNVYAGLATSTGTMITTIPSTDLTITISNNASIYYAVYSKQVAIYYPDTVSTRARDNPYRNQWFISASEMSATVLSTTSTGMTDDYVFTSSVQGYDLYGFSTTYNNVNSTYSTVASFRDRDSLTAYAILYKVVPGTFYYYDGTGQATVTADANQYIRCTSSAAGISNSPYSVPSIVAASTGPGDNVYRGVSTVVNSTTTTTTINTSTTVYYAVYGGDFTATFTTENNNVSSIGSTSLSCNGYHLTDGTTYSGTTCSITLPSITAASGYTVLGWFNGMALIGQPNTTYTLTGNTTYTAKASIIEARDLYYNNTNSGVECDDVQCMIDFLDSGDHTNATLSPGDYVSYTPSSSSYTTDTTITGYSTAQTINPSELTLWRVLSLNQDGTVDIISENVSSVAVTFNGLTGYKNFVGYLNVLSSQYENSAYTVGSRHFGYNGQTLGIASDKYFTVLVPWACSSNFSCTPNPKDYEAYGGGDMAYINDSDLLYRVLGTRIAKKAGTSTATPYWIATRYYYNPGDGSFSWGLRYMMNDGNNTTVYLYRYNRYDLRLDSYGASYAIRPIVTLKAGLSYTGSGTSGSPWVISTNS